ncbi:MAG: hypothetical protein CMJ21_03270 [Phycisphaerae bacterium]|nr:hypothetical protein [Phycisphaerae bacterium]
MQRYVALARCHECQWLFRVSVSDDSLLPAPGKWRLAGANYSPGVRHVWLNRHARSGLSGICIDCHD